MAQSRKDSRGYALRNGECQRSDGRYSYSYTDKNRKRHTVYASDLVELKKKSRRSGAIWRMGWIPGELSVLQSIRYTIRISNRNTT